MDGGATGGGDPVENQSPGIGDLISMSVGEFLQDADPNGAADIGPLAAANGVVSAASIGLWA